MSKDDKELAAEMATHLYDHAERVEDCKVCHEVLMHLSRWFETKTLRQENLSDDAMAKYGVTLSSNNRWVIRHTTCDRADDTVAEWPSAQGWTLTLEDMLAEAAIHAKEHHRDG